MSKSNPVFKKNYIHYMNRLKHIDLNHLASKLGIKTDDPKTIFVFNKKFIVTNQGFTDLDGKRPSYDICVILAKYILMCPDSTPKENDWVSFRDFKDSGPLAGYISNDVENKINRNFTGRTDALKRAGQKLRGYAPDISAEYDVMIRFDAMPKVPLVLLFNDGDEEFGAQTKLLFEKRAEKYLDVECLAILGNLLCRKLEQST